MPNINSTNLSEDQVVNDFTKERNLQTSNANVLFLIIDKFNKYTEFLVYIGFFDKTVCRLSHGISYINFIVIKRQSLSFLALS